MPHETSVPSESAMKDTPKLFDDEVDRVNKILAYARKIEKAMFYGCLATIANLLKYLWHPLERRFEGLKLRIALDECQI